MKKRLAPFIKAGAALCFCGILCTGAKVRAAAGENGQGAQLTRMMEEVKIAAPHGTPQLAAVNQRLAEGGSIRTGPEARAELSFPDGTVARFGGRSVCALTSNSQVLELEEGAVLFEAPAKAGGKMRIRSGGITISFRGVTGIMERHEKLYLKILVLQGTARVYSGKIGESVLVTPGQMLITKPGNATLPEAVNFDLAHLYKTSLLMNSGFAPLASRDEILRAIEKQKSDPDFIPTNLIIYGRGTLVNLVPPSATPTPHPLPKRRP